MSVPVPNLEGSHSGGSFSATSTYTHRKKNDCGQWQDFVDVKTNTYPTWQSYKSAKRHSVWSMRQGQLWRPPTDYTRMGKRWSYRASHPEIPWYKNGHSSWECGDEWTGPDEVGCNMGDTHFTDYGIPYHPERGNLLQGARTECMLKLNDGKVNLGNTLGESLTTAEMLADTGSGLLRLLHDAKRGRWSQIAKEYGVVLDTLGNGYLAWKYGWKPLCSDIYEIHKQLTSRSNQSHRLSASRTKSASYSGPDSSYGLPVDVKAKTRCTVKVYAEISDSVLAKSASYGLNNPLSLTWELIPWSFVADWFMPVGNTLAALSSHDGLTFVGGFESSTVEGKATITSPICGYADLEMLYFERAALTNWPDTSQFYWNVNPFKSSGRIASALALLNQLK
jgi:hypothetical protein